MVLESKTHNIKKEERERKTLIEIVVMKKTKSMDCVSLNL